MITCQSQRLARFLNRLVLVTLVASMTFGLLAPVAATVVHAEAQPTTVVSSSATSMEKAPAASVSTASDPTAAATSQAGEQAAAAKTAEQAVAEAKAAEQAAYQAKVQQVKHYQQGFLTGWKAQGDADQGARLTDPEEQLGFAQGLAANSARVNLMGTGYADALNRAALAYAAKLGVAAADVDQLPAIATRAAVAGNWGTGGSSKYTIDSDGKVLITGGVDVAGVRGFFVPYKQQITSVEIQDVVKLKSGLDAYKDGPGVNLFSDLPNVTSITGLERIVFPSDGNARTMLSGLPKLATIKFDDGDHPERSTGITDYRRMLAGDTALTAITFNVDTTKIANKAAANTSSPTANPFPFGSGAFDLAAGQKGLVISIGWLVDAEIKLPVDNLPAGYRWVDAETEAPAKDGVFWGAKAEGLSQAGVQYKTYKLAPIYHANLNYVGADPTPIKTETLPQTSAGAVVKATLLDMYAEGQMTGAFANYVYKDDPYQLNGLTKEIAEDTDVKLMAVQAKGLLGTVAWYVDMAGALHFGPGTLPNDMAKKFEAQKAMIKAITFDGQVVAGTSLANAFRGLNQVVAISNLRNLNTSKTITLDHTFSEMNSLVELDPDVGKLNTANVLNFTGVFTGDIKLRKLDLNGWDVTKGQYMTGMFQTMTALEEIHVDQWQTSAMTNIINAFLGTPNLKTLDLQNWDFRKSVDNVPVMMLGANLTELTLGPNATKAITVATPANRQWVGLKNQKNFTGQFDPKLGADTYRLGNKVSFQLVDAYTGAVLKDSSFAVFNVVDASGAPVNTVTLMQGSLTKPISLADGEYTLTSVFGTVDGYGELGTYKVIVSQDQVDATGVQTVRIELIPKFDSIIPNTGGNGQLYFYLAVAALGGTAIAIGVWLLNRRHRELAALLDRIKKLN